MPASVLVPVAHLESLVEAIFETPAVAVFTSDSDYGEETLEFHSAAEVLAHFHRKVAAGSLFEGYAVHYTETGGHVANRRIVLDPKKCKGHTFRYSLGGWGVIHVQVKLRGPSMTDCTISANSQKRAEAWAGTAPEFKSPTLWNWPLVEKHARRLCRQLKKSAQLSIRADAP